MAKQWHEYPYKTWGNKEWDRPVDESLLADIGKLIASGRRPYFEDCLVAPSGTRILAIHNAYPWGEDGTFRVLYSYATSDGGTAPGTALLRWLDQDSQIHNGGP